MENVVQFWSNAMAGASSVLDGFLNGVKPWQLLTAAAILLVLVIILICALSSRGRKVDELAQAQESAQREARRLEEESRRAIADKEKEMRRALNQKEEEMAQAISQKDSTLTKVEQEKSVLKQNVDELTRFRDEYIQIPNAKAEATRIIREAKDHAYVVANRTEMEYAEIIEHANQEAENIRALAQQRLARSHDALKAALARANEIVEEAHAEATRIAKITYAAGPSLIEAPEAEASAPEENAPEASAPQQDDQPAEQDGAEE